MANTAAAAAPASLADVLRAPSCSDAIFRILSAYPSFLPDLALASSKGHASARLACRALRDAIDGSVTRLFLTLTPADAQHWRPGLLHERWPRCSNVSVRIAAAKGDARDGGAAALLALPFEGLQQPAAGATRIARVALYSEEGAARTGTESAITLVAQRLPWLAQLDLSGLNADDLSYEPEQLARMWQALAAAPELVDVRLPSLQALAGAKAVPPLSRLRSVEARIDDSPTNSVCAEAAAVVSHLTALETLVFSNASADSVKACLPHVLNSLPASLKKLAVEEVEDAIQLQLGFEDGRIISVEMPDGVDDEVTLVALAELAGLADMLQRTRALGPRIQRLSVPYVSIGGEFPALGWDEAESLRALVARADVVELHDVIISLDSDFDLNSGVEALMQAVDLFGKPARLQFWHDSKLTLHVKDSPGDGGASGGAAGVAPGGELPSVPSFLRAAMLHLEADAEAAAAAARSAPADAAAPTPHMLLLSGPAVAAQADGDCLLSWVSELDGGVCLHYTSVSQADVLLLQMRSRADAEAAAAQAVQAWAAGGLRSLIWPAPTPAANCGVACIRKAVGKELQAVWVPRFAGAARCEEPALLRWLWDVYVCFEAEELDDDYSDYGSADCG